MAETLTVTGLLTDAIKLMDLNIDCLENIFIHSSIVDIVNIAHTNKQMKPAADLAFIRTFSKMLFCFHITSPNPEELSQSTGESVNMFDLQISLRLLRCFGHLITRFQIEYSKKMRSAITKVIHYANKYGSKSLNTMSFHNIFKYAFESSIRKPFANVENVEFHKCHLGEKISNFNIWFPSMRRLDLIKNTFDNEQRIKKTFPKLEHFGVVSCSIPSKHILVIIRLNTQLRSISLGRAYTPQYFRAFSKHLTQLECLELFGCPNDFSGFSGDFVHFKSVKKLVIFYSCWNFELISGIKFAFDQLEEITLDLNGNGWTDGLIEFHQKHRTITKVTLRTINGNTNAINDDILINIVATLPLLNELNFFGIFFPTEKILHFLHKFKIMVCGFLVDDLSQFEFLKAALGNEWCATINIPCLKLERKVEYE